MSATDRSADFAGTIGRTLAESEPWWPEPAHPGEHAPNVVVILFDDLGFSHFGCYGSDIETPNIDRLAAGGIRYSNFHVTPLCSPTRAALLTGRNHHTVGMRAISNFSTGFPHMRGHITDEATTMAEVLRGDGLRDLHDRQMAPLPDGRGLRGRAVRQLAAPTGLRSLLRVPRRRDRPVHARPHLRQPPGRPAPHAGGGLPPDRGPGRQDHRVHQRLGLDQARSALLHVPGPRRHPRPSPGTCGVPGPPQGSLRRRLGRGPRPLVRPPAGARRHPTRHRAGAQEPRRRRVGRPARGTATSGRPTPGGVRRVPRAHR